MAQTAQARGREVALARRRALARSGKAAIRASAAPSQAAGSTTSAGPANYSAARSEQGGSSARAASRARRAAMSERGKAGITRKDRVRGGAATAGAGASAPATPPPAAAPSQAAQGQSTKEGCGCGCKDDGSAEAKPRAGQSRARSASAKVRKAQARLQPPKAMADNSSRAVALARRKALSSRGKAGISKNGMSAAQTARAANPQMSGRELAQTLREQRSRRGAAGEKKAETRSRAYARNKAAKDSAGGAQDAPWKVGYSETVHGQGLTGTMVGRSGRVTGDEASTCRTVTGTEYMGADIFREFCQTDPVRSPRKVALSPTSRGGQVTGNEVGRGSRVTGNEPGTCKRVTGTEYVGANQVESYCGNKAEPGARKIAASETQKGRSVTGSAVDRNARVTGGEAGGRLRPTGSQYVQASESTGPLKVGTTRTYRGGSVTGTMVGRNAHVTGDEPGSCRNVTGDEYVGQEQYSDFCASTPAPQDEKVRLSQTLKGRQVSGTIPGRGERVTGDEPGTCKAITGTPYAGAEQYRSYCRPEDSDLAVVRTPRQRSTPGSVMTGLQPGLGGKATGDARGACTDVSGTPYVGADQFGAACPAAPAQPGEADFPQVLPQQGMAENGPARPNGSSVPAMGASAVTGSSYEQGRITGPFGKAGGRVTGTEEFRFGPRDRAAAPAPAAPAVEAVAEAERPKSRVTGEGMDLGKRITGDDWDRGDRVTGTEGTTATQRNPTRRGGAMSAMDNARPKKRNDEVEAPVSRVTGGSGNTERGALVTYSGGARG